MSNAARMEQLVRHVIDPLLEHPDDVSIQAVTGEAAIMLELVTHPDDRAKLEADQGRTLRAVRTTLSAAAGRSKATLDLVDAHGEASSEE